MLGPRRTVCRWDLEEPRFLTLIQPVIALCLLMKVRWEYIDEKLDNFIMFDDGRVMIVDLD